mgnify:CR=1 FL=1
MKNSQESLEEIIKSTILSGPLQEIKLYQVNNTFFELPSEGYWIIDTGIELRFPSGIISAVWNTEIECYVIENKGVELIYGQDNVLQLENKNIAGLKKFVGLHVIDVNIKSIEFDFIADYRMQIEKEKRIVEMILDFQNKSKIQIAFVNYALEVNNQPRDFSFDISTELLISTKKIIEIKNAL